MTRWVNLLGIGGVALAVWALIVVIAVFSGFIGEIREHIRVSSPELLLTNLDPDRDHSYDDLRAVIEADDDVAATAPRLTHYGIYYPTGRGRELARTRAQGFDSHAFNYVSLLGIDPAREAGVTELQRWMEPPLSDYEPLRVEVRADPFRISPDRVRLPRESGGPKTPILSTPAGILLAFSRMLKPSDPVRPGMLMNLVSADEKENGELRYIRWSFVSSGGFETGHRLFDDSTAIVDIEELRTILGHDIDRMDSVDLVSSVAIRPRPGVDLAALAARLTDSCRPLSAGHVLTWEEQNAVFLGAVDQERGLMKIVLFAVMLVAGFLVYATLHMMVTQKTKDIGILTSMGATQGSIQAIFILSGLVVATVGCTLGALSGYVSVLLMNPINDWVYATFEAELFPRRVYNMSEVPYRLEADWILTVIFAAVALSLVVAWLPARRAARMEPVQALSYE